MRVLVTGGAGFIGGNLCRDLLARPDVTSVIALDDLSTGHECNLDGLDVEFVRGSILDRGLLGEVMRGVDAVAHLAARPSVPRSLADPVASHHANATGTLHVLEEARRHGAYVAVASSSSVYGSAAGLPKHENLPTRPLSPYAAGKLATEAYALAYQAAFGLPVLPLRFFNVYGPLQAAGHAYAAVVPAFVDAALRGDPLIVHGDGRQTRDFTFVGSVTRVLGDAITRGVTSDVPVNLAFGTRVSVLELAALVGDVLCAPVEVVHGPARPGEVRDSQACDRRLQAMFPDARRVALEEGIRQTISWFQSRSTRAPEHLARVSST